MQKKQNVIVTGVITFAVICCSRNVFGRALEDDAEFILTSEKISSTTETNSNGSIIRRVDISEDDDVNAKPEKSRILQRILNPEIYDKSIRPSGGGTDGTDPVRVGITMFLRSVENIDDVKMEYTVQMSFREEWVDPRLKYDHMHNVNIKYLQLVNPNRIWVPDVFFSNEKTGSLHDLLLPNFFGRIFPDGRVLISYRITLLLSCSMNLRHYPMDKQSCPVRMTSYGWTTNDIILSWPNSTNMQVSDFNMPRFKLTNHSMVGCQSITSTGSYSCIELLLNFERQFGYYLIQIYAPCIMLVLVSWVAFWLEPTATEARVSLAITSILTVVTQTDGINQNVPPASYIKAIDVWTFMVQFMVFSVVLQFSYVNYLARYQWKKHARKLDVSDEAMWVKTEAELKEQGEARAKRIDNISKIFFPALFGFFNVAYWTAYLGARSHPYAS